MVVLHFHRDEGANIVRCGMVGQALSSWVFCGDGFPSNSLNSTSFLDRGRLVLVSLLSPCLNVIPFIALWAAVAADYAITLQRLLFFIFSPVLAVAASYFFLYLINDVADESLGVPALSLFKAFLLSWIADVNDPFEEFLERLSEKQAVDLGLFKFDSSEREVCVVVPSVHPGPFKNIGSSVLPYLLKHALEKKFGCVACVPHGLFGHELDLASQAQNQKIVNNVVERDGFSGFWGGGFALLDDQ